jgi:hypothetical protein
MAERAVAAVAGNRPVVGLDGLEGLAKLRR